MFSLQQSLLAALVLLASLASVSSIRETIHVAKPVKARFYLQDASTGTAYPEPVEGCHPPAYQFEMYALIPASLWRTELCGKSLLISSKKARTAIIAVGPSKDGSVIGAWSTEDALGVAPGDRVTVG